MCPVPGAALGFRCQAHGPHWPHRMPHNVATREGLLGPGPCWGVEWARAGTPVPPSLIAGCGACSELSPTLGGPRGATASCLGGPCKREGGQGRGAEASGGAAIQVGFSRMDRSFLTEKDGQRGLRIKATSQGGSRTQGRLGTTGFSS